MVPGGSREVSCAAVGGQWFKICQVRLCVLMAALSWQVNPGGERGDKKAI